MLILIVVGAVLLQQAWGVKETLTDDEVYRLPELFSLDKYYQCLRKPGDSYAYVTAQIVGNSSNEVYNTLQEYSAHNLIHYNRTLVHRGICMQQSCQEFLGRQNLTDALEACLNFTLERDYQLNARIINTMWTDYQEKVTFDRSDYVFIAVTLVLLLLNLLGSVYEFFCKEGDRSFVTKFLLCFAIKRNWKALLGKQDSDSKMNRLKCLSSFRSISIFLIVLGHSPLSALITSSNYTEVERAYDNILFHILYNGTLIVQTFFIISGLLRMYTTLVTNERKKTTWTSLPSSILNRWFRLTPPYALVMFFVMTLGRYFGDGPLWKPIVMAEVTDCRNAWWLHLLYIQNYIEHNQCMAHAWYLAADFQLSVLGLVVISVLSSARAQKMAIGAMFVVGLITPAVHVFVQNLHAILIVSPEMALNYFVNDDTFNNLYKRGHTNLSCYALGFACAYYIYNLKESDIGSNKYKKYRFFYWMMFPIELLMVLTGATFYIPGIQVPLGVRMVYASAIKVLFGGMICFHICFTILKVDKVCRGVLDWGGWSSIGKLTYCVYLVHVAVLRTAAADNDVLSRATYYKIVLDYIALLGMSFALALPLHFFVEAPFINLVKTFIVRPASKKVKSKSVSIADIVSSKETIEAKI